MSNRFVAEDSDFERTPSEFAEALAAYVAGAVQLRKAHYDEAGYDYSPGKTFEFDIVAQEPHGPKYVRIVNIERGEQRSVYSFVERRTGDVFKADGWKKPAKHARGNIYSAGHGLETHTQYGPAYLKR